MPKKTPDPAAALQKLGQHLRIIYALKNPARSLDVVRAAVRQQYTEQQRTRRVAKPAPDATKGKQRKPPEPDIER